MVDKAGREARRQRVEGVSLALAAMCRMSRPSRLHYRVNRDGARSNDRPTADFRSTIVRAASGPGARHRFFGRDVAVHIAERIGTINGVYRDALDLSSREEGFEEIQQEADRWTRSSLIECSENVVADEEALPFPPASFDLITSILSLHAVNDLPGALIQIRRTLRPNGLFVAGHVRRRHVAGTTQIVCVC